MSQTTSVSQSFAPALNLAWGPTVPRVVTPDGVVSVGDTLLHRLEVRLRQQPAKETRVAWTYRGDRFATTLYGGNLRPDEEGWYTLYCWIPTRIHSATDSSGALAVSVRYGSAEAATARDITARVEGAPDQIGGAGEPVVVWRSAALSFPSDQPLPAELPPARGEAVQSAVYTRLGAADTEAARIATTARQQAERTWAAGERPAIEAGRQAGWTQPLTASWLNRRLAPATDAATVAGLTLAYRAASYARPVSWPVVLPTGRTVSIALPPELLPPPVDPLGSVKRQVVTAADDTQCEVWPDVVDAHVVDADERLVEVGDGVWAVVMDSITIMRPDLRRQRILLHAPRPVAVGNPLKTVENLSSVTATLSHPMAFLNRGTRAADGTYSLDVDDLGYLQVTPPRKGTARVTLTVQALRGSGADAQAVSGAVALIRPAAGLAGPWGLAAGWDTDMPWEVVT